MTKVDPLAQITLALESLPQGLQEHIQRVRDIAAELALRHGLDPHQADLAAAAHDLARAFKAEELLVQTREAGLSLHPVEEALPVLLHGPLAAHWLRWRYGTEDSEVLEAVRWHSTANRGLSLLAKLTFLADKLDPPKLSRYPFLEQVRALAWEDLDAALLEFLQQEVRALLEAGRLIHHASIEARNELLARREGERPHL